MSINLIKTIEKELEQKELEQIWIENTFLITDYISIDDDTNQNHCKYRISNIQDKFDNKYYIYDNVKDMQMYVENYGWVDVLTGFDQISIVFIISTVTRFRKLLFLPKVEKLLIDLDKDIDANKMRELFFRSILPDLKKSIDKKTNKIYIDGSISNDMQMFLEKKGLKSFYSSGTGKTQIYF